MVSRWNAHGNDQTPAQMNNLPATLPLTSLATLRRERKEKKQTVNCLTAKTTAFPSAAATTACVEIVVEIGSQETINAPSAEQEPSPLKARSPDGASSPGMPGRPTKRLKTRTIRPVRWNPTRPVLWSLRYAQCVTLRLGVTADPASDLNAIVLYMYDACFGHVGATQSMRPEPLQPGSRHHPQERTPLRLQWDKNHSKK